jgi:transposase
MERCAISARSKRRRRQWSASCASWRKSIRACISANEAGPTGYGLYRQIVELGHRCDVVAPSLIPKRPGERVKTNRRDAICLARLLRADELKGIWVPDAVHEAVRDLVRVRAAASEDLRKKRQMLLSFLLRHGRVFTGRKNWSRAYAPAGWRRKSSIIQPSRSCSRTRST